MSKVHYASLLSIDRSKQTESDTFEADENYIQSIKS